MSAPAAASQAQRDRRRRRLPTWARRLVWVLSIGVLVLAMFALVAVLFFSDRVIGPSMLVGLHSGDRALVNPLAYAFGSP